jgi:mRNA interferase MazF
MFGIISGMQKDFAGWHIEKTRLQGLTQVPYCHEQEIWWMAVGCNIGYEEDGKGVSFARPVLIIKKFSYRFILGVPFSSTSRTGPYYYRVNVTGHDSTALLSQIRAFDARRLLIPFGCVSAEEFQAIKEKLKNLF